MEIQENEYVRTDNGQIFKVLEVEKGSVKIKSDYREWIGICCIQKHSFNIIDLIEVGDYVNGCLVVKHSYKPELYVSYVYVGGKIQTTIEDYTSKLEDIEIKSIVTKQAFESIKYEV